MCVDPQDLNRAIKRERTEAVSLMSNAKYVSVLDVSQGFWQIKLDEESFICCTFNTPTGRCCFLRLPDHGRRLAPISFTASVQNICFDSKLKYPEIPKPSEATSRGVKNMLKKGRKQQVTRTFHYLNTSTHQRGGVHCKNYNLSKINYLN